MNGKNILEHLSSCEHYLVYTRKKGKNYYSKAIDDKASKKYH